ncbi:MAG: transporter, family, fosmidomycin resistance protein [Moorella sp. (in: firmicutes)]|uniref:Fosmidomycin resistance protein n=1 Tax=Neomoorella thermoacetica TaxID=1525 RepID=A0A1J5NSJ0_NEOTH|nr:transporter, family, fosmidomycin resistance protein [Moorella sp. (in: firmicutes)]OIQ58244.1 fosmidomycin resistance protein [Moorella thermoacetica]
MRKRILYLLGLGHMVIDIYQGLLPIFLSVYKNEYGLSYAAAGLVVFLSNISSSVIQPLFGYWSDRHQMRWLLPAGCLVAGLGMVAAGYAANYYLLVAAVFISGLGVAAYHPEASKSAHYISGPRQASSMSIFSVGGNLGFGLGPLIATFILSHGGLRASWMLLIPTAIIVVLLSHALPVLGRAMAGGHQVPPAGNPRAKTGQAPLVAIILLVLVVIMRSWLQSGLTYYIPFYYLNYLHGNEHFASSMLSIFLMAGAVGTLVGGRLADYWGTKKMIIGSMLVLIPMVVAFPYIQGAWVAILLALSGFALVSTFAPAIVLAQNILPEHVGVASGLMMGFAIGTGGLGTFLLGSIADAHGVPFTIQIMAVIPAIGAILAFFLPDLRRRPAAQQITIEPVPVEKNNRA